MEPVCPAVDDVKDRSNGVATNKEGGVALCASCDRCRARKTKCDGKRPCGNCATRYMKKHRLSSIEGVDIKEFGCVYSPAKRRGPIPGRNVFRSRPRSSNGLKRPKPASPAATLMQERAEQARAAVANAAWNHGGAGEFNGVPGAAGGGALGVALGAGAALGAGVLFPGVGSSSALQLLNQQQHPQGALGGLSGVGGGGDALQQQLHLLHRLQQHNQQHPSVADDMDQIASMHQHATAGAAGGGLHMGAGGEPPQRRVKLNQDSSPPAVPGGVPRTITQHTHLLERTNSEGSRLHAYFKLSIDELFCLPPTPTDTEYCARCIDPPNMTPSMIPGSHLAALSAARFAEIALGAIVHNEVSLAMELCNAVVHCLRESVSEPVQAPVMLEVAKAYFLLGIFRAFRGDMARYFKYRRVCLTYVSKLDDDSETATLLAAVSYLDSWAYMIYNANEKALPSVDETIPPVAAMPQQPTFSSSAEMKYGVKTGTRSIASDRKNQNWIQGAPPIYLNSEAPLHARSLDALACAMRTCVDQANGRFAAMVNENTSNGSGNAVATGNGSSNAISQETIVTPTTTAVLAHENELCSRNMVLSAYKLMQQQESSSRGRHKNLGQHLVISAMDAFLENSEDQEGAGGFTDSQIQSLLSVCNTAIENPFLLHHAGPTYHMVTNAAILLCHLLNGMHAMKVNATSDNDPSQQSFGPMEATMFEEVLDTFISIRKLLTIHRRKLPVKLRCHGIPRPALDSSSLREGQPFIDLGETLLCSCRGCQGFVLMACSPCVAAERARKASARMQIEEAQEAQVLELGELDKEIDDLGAEFDLDDDALLNMISGLISN